MISGLHSMLDFHHFPNCKLVRSRRCVLFVVCVLGAALLTLALSASRRNHVLISGPICPHGRRNGSASRPEVLCTGLVGVGKLGLGNCMFQFASGYALARNYGRRFVYYDRDSVLGELFNISAWKAGCVCETEIAERHYAIHQDFSKLSAAHLSNRSVLINGYLQSWKYFARYHDDIKRIFSLPVSIVSMATKILDDLSAQFETRTAKMNSFKSLAIASPIKRWAIHVRLGDGFREPPEKAFLRRAMAVVKTTEKPSRVMFVVVSDDTVRCRSVFSELDDDLVYSGCPDDHCDLALMTLADGVITTRVSTFSWWAGWLAGTRVIYDVHAKSRHQEHFSAQDYIPPGWMGV